MVPRIWEAPCSGPYQDRALGVAGKRLGIRHLGCEEELRSGPWNLGDTEKRVQDFKV